MLPEARRSPEGDHLFALLHLLRRPHAAEAGAIARRPGEKRQVLRVRGNGGGFEPGLDGDELAGGLRRPRGHMSAGKAGRIRILVINIDKKSEPLALFERIPPQAKPLRAQIIGHQSRARVNERAAHPLLAVLRQHLLDPSGLHLVVPHPQGHRAELGRGICEALPDLFGRHRRRRRERLGLRRRGGLPRQQGEGGGRCEKHASHH
jgi:hypothetical protein